MTGSDHGPGREGQERGVLCVVDPNLKDLLGHHFEYDYSLMLAAQKLGWRFMALGHARAEESIASRMPVERRFRLSIGALVEPLPRLPKFGRKVVKKVIRKLDLFLTNYYVYRVLRARFGHITDLSDWVIFGHMMTMHELLGWSWWIASLPRKNSPRVALLFRYDTDWFVHHPQFPQAVQILRGAPLGDRLQLYADTDRLARDYERCLPFHVGVLPIPHAAHLRCQPARVLPAGGRPLCLVSAGNAREEKGFLDILQAIRLLEKAGELGHFSFILQANDTSEAIRREMAAMTERGTPSVTFLQEKLSTDAYYRLLGQADAVLLPYDGKRYRSRSSGILAEALAAGKPVVVTENTWLSDQMKAFGGGVLCRSGDPADLARAIRELGANFDAQRQRAEMGRNDWVRLHNPEALVRALTNPAGP